MLGGHLDFVDDGHAVGNYSTSTATADVGTPFPPIALLAVFFVDALNFLVAAFGSSGGNPLSYGLRIGQDAPSKRW